MFTNIYPTGLSRDIIVLLQMWDEPFVEGSKERWGMNPFNPANNINNIPGLPAGDGSAEEEFYDPDNEELMHFQDALIRKLLDETAGAYGNIIYEIGNEINMDSRTPKDSAWQKHWIDFFDKYEREHGIELLLSNDTRRELFDNGAEAFDITNHHGFTGFGIRQSKRGNLSGQVYKAVQHDFEKYGKPVVNSRPCSDPDRKNYPDIVSEDIGRELYWSYFCSGGHIIGFRTTEESWKGGLAAERTIRSVQTFVKRLSLERFVPHREIADSGLCLADVGREYVIYLPEGGTVSIDLSEVKGDMITAWYNPRECRDEKVEEIQADGILTFQTPDKNDWVLHLVKKNK
ncbi:putative collagen-binding domain-containing protein [Candidatus Latescibacterota bacterium]